MNQTNRTWLRGLATAAALALGGLAHALTLTPYDPAAFAKAQAAGAPVALQFHADWCPTCRAQDKAFGKLKADKDLGLTIYVVDYDHEQALEQQLKVRAQSTLIVYRGKAEKYRITGVSDVDGLREVLRAAFDGAKAN
ncbi:MAG: thioredoxin family protein [Pelomonas sp.]|nr:thioredoxin family protein [Roseateles sp.]